MKKQNVFVIIVIDQTASKVGTLRFEIRGVRHFEETWRRRYNHLRPTPCAQRGELGEKIVRFSPSRNTGGRKWGARYFPPFPPAEYYL
jgi:hypothetical protein